jgi:DNA-binding MarR family transcriptional regulator
MSANRPPPGRNIAATGSSIRDPINDDSEDVSQSIFKTITLSERDIRAAAKLLNALVAVEADRSKELARLARKGGSHGDNNRRLLVEEARRTFAKRAQRSRFLGSSMFGEAAWDMLLALYVTEQSGSRHTVTGLLDLAGVPPTTALRWLDFLEEDDLVTRQPSPTDRRVNYVELTDKARKALDAYFSATLAP